GYQMAGGGPGVAQGIENRDARTQQRRGFGCGEIVGDGGNRLGGRNHIFRITTVMADAGNFLVLAEIEIAAAAGIASEIMTSVPSDSDALAGFPVGNVSADGVDAAGDFVSGNARILDARPIAFLDQRIAVADATGFNFNSDLTAAGFGNVSFDEFEISAGFADLDSFHLRHSSFLMNSGWWKY